MAKLIRSIRRFVSTKLRLVSIYVPMGSSSFVIECQNHSDHEPRVNHLGFVLSIRLSISRHVRHSFCSYKFFRCYFGRSFSHTKCSLFMVAPPILCSLLSVACNSAIFSRSRFVCGCIEKEENKCQYSFDLILYTTVQPYFST